MHAPLMTTLAMAAAVLVIGCTNDTQEVQSTKDSQMVGSKTSADKSIAKVDTPTTVQPIEVKKGVLMNQGTVRRINLEGGFWGIITDDGRKILPQNLAKEYQKDGLRISFNSQEVKGMMTIQQWGTLSTLKSIKVIGQVDSQATDPHI
ncbi:hypothetical protein [Shewanella waksmanii]|uniref:hypothetical protein n=1 Tax=Shewanella waksmanii TaxID=213783 RepID=UPI003736BBF4